jgi:hypothetical protein
VNHAAPPNAFHGVILAPNDAISLTNANLDGRVFGSDSSDMQIVSGATVNASVPEEGSGCCYWLLLAAAGGIMRKPLSGIARR